MMLFHLWLRSLSVIWTTFSFLLFVSVVAAPLAHAEDPAVALPAGVTAVWDEAKAFHETTPTRERISLNGLWRWQPAQPNDTEAPVAKWGYFKVPGPWPGISDYMQKDCQTVFAHPAWKDAKIASLAAAWYERTVSVPAGWAGRRITLDLDHLNSYAAVYIDGKRASEISFPGGELDLSAALHSGATQTLSLLVVALPLKGVLLSYTDSAHAREVKGSVPRRGLCGDVFLSGAPQGPHITEVRIATSVREKELRLSPVFEGLATDARYTLRAQIFSDSQLVKEFTAPSFASNALQAGRLPLTEKWLPDKLWDLNSPGNLYDLELTLQDAEGRALDTTWKSRFGFREFWIDGRDFQLNGSRIFLSAVPLDNAQIGAAFATYEAARETMARLKSFGINYVYTHNYDCLPGSTLSFAEILRAADDEGLLVGFTQPHFSHYDWKADDADRNNGYARHAAACVREAGCHPSVIMYPMSHNSTGYEEDMNPDMIDGLHDPRDTWSAKNVKLALRAEAIVEQLDPARIVYHHASGNLGVMHDSNFYSNFAPVQEISDWFTHWAAVGVKPAFACEYGAPFAWDWTMYRGWYKGEREFGSGNVPWEYCLAEWNSQFLGDQSYRLSEAEKANLRWEAGKFRSGSLWHRWDYPNPPSSPRLEECQPVLAMYTADNWRAFRTLGVSGISPWGYGEYWKLRDGVKRGRRDFPVDWDKLQRSGFSPDYLVEQYDRYDLGYERSDWIPMAAAHALLRNNQPLLAYIAGQAGHPTGKDHNFRCGETVEKLAVVINNSRSPVTCDVTWAIPELGVSEHKSISIPTGDQIRIPIHFVLPISALSAGPCEIQLRAKFANGEQQDDRFVIHSLPAPAPPPVARIALFDPKGETAKLLATLGVHAQIVDASADLKDFDLLVVGKGALTADGPAPDIRRVRDGLKVLLFEQTTAALQNRFGFRINEYGLRQVFPRVEEHPALIGLDPERLRDWRGSATILPEKLAYELRPRYGPTVQWNGLSVPHIWRCGTAGNVASVLIEKPPRGDFFPIVDGGFNLQYSPLLEHRVGAGLMLFCQLDVTGRSEDDPAAATLAQNLLRYAAAWKPAAPPRHAVYAGEAEGKEYLKSAGVDASDYSGAPLTADELLIVAPGSAAALGRHGPDIVAWLKNGGQAIGLGLGQADLDAFLPGLCRVQPGEHIAATFDLFPAASLFAGVGPADVHNRDPRTLPLVVDGAQVYGDGVLARVQNLNVALCQMAPWQFKGPAEQLNLRRTYRRSAFLASRLLANLGVASPPPLPERFQSPAKADEQRWNSGLYLDQPIEWDDPYRFFRW